MSRLSMSKLGLAHKCGYGFRADVPAPERPSGRAAQIGSIVHALVEAKVTGKAYADDVDPTLLSEAMAIFTGPLSDYLESRKWTVCEKGYRYDSENDTCVDGPRRGDPGYDDHADDALKGTVDLVEVDGEEGVVDDVKTGKPPEDSEQLYGQAVAVSRRFGLRRVRVAYARALKTKLELLNAEFLDADRLDAEAGRIRRLLRTIPTSEPNPGEWCWKCDAWQACPAKARDDRYVDPPSPSDVTLLNEDVSLF
jgi:hypothetical protein